MPFEFVFVRNFYPATVAGAVRRVELVTQPTVRVHVGLEHRGIAPITFLRIRGQWFASLFFNVPFENVFVRNFDPAMVACAVCCVALVADNMVRGHVGNITFFAVKACLRVRNEWACFLVTVYLGLFGVFIRTAIFTRRSRIGSFAKSHVEFSCPASTLETKGAVGN